MISKKQKTMENRRIIKAYLDNHPKATVTECRKATGLQHTVVNRHMEFLKIISLDD